MYFSGFCFVALFIFSRLLTSLLAISASTSNMTSLSNKEVESIGKKYKSESTKEIILKGFNVYWLAEDTEHVKIKAENVPNAEEPSGNRRSYFLSMYTNATNSSGSILFPDTSKGKR